MESDIGYTFFFKYVFLLISIISGITGILSYFFPETVTINGEQANIDLTSYAIIGFIVVLGIILHLLTSYQFIRVRLDGQNINLISQENKEPVSWLNVESINKIPVVFPPLYKLKIKDDTGFYLFTTKPNYLQFNIGTMDISEMGDFIKKKKRELGI